MTRVVGQWAILILATVIPSIAAAAQPADATEIIKESDAATKSKTEKTTYRMTLLAADGTIEQTRTFITYYKRNDGEQRTLQKFLSPPALSGTGLLIVDSGQPDNSIWLYLPTTRRIRRVAGHDKSDRYMGTEFSYEDFQDYRIPYYSFSLVGERQDTEGRECWVIDAVASAPSEISSTGYSKRRYWIGRKSLYPVRVEYFGADRALEKVLIAHDLHREGRYWRPRSEEMTNVLNKRVTKLVIQSDEVDQPLDDRYVSQRYLRED